MQFQGMKKEIVSHLQLEPRMGNTIVKFEARQLKNGALNLFYFIYFIILFFLEIGRTYKNPELIKQGSKLVFL